MGNAFLWDRQKKNWLFLPVAMVLAVLPFVVRATQHFLSGELYRLFLTNRKTELFSQYRARFVWIMAAVMLVLLVVFGRRLLAGIGRLEWFYFSACAVFLLFLILSTCLSEYPDTAFWGQYDRAEGMYTQIAYLVLFLYTMLSCRTSVDLKWAMAALGVVIAVNLVMGISQFIGHDLMTSDWVNWLVVPEEIGGKISTLQFEKAKMYGTTNHYNYLGSLAAMLLPICTVFALWEKRWKYRGPAIAAAVASLVLLLGSTSRAGLMGAAAAAGFGVFFFRRSFFRYKKQVLAVAAGLTVATVGANAVLDNAIFERVPMLLADVGTLFSDTSDFDFHTEMQIQGVENTDDGAVIVVQGGELTLGVENGTVVFHDQEGQEVPFQKNEDGVLVTQTEPFSFLGFRSVNTSDGKKSYTYLRLLYNGKQLLQFYYDEEKLYLVKTGTTEPMTLEDPPVADFWKGKERIGSMRGYIWGRTIPLMPEHLLIGAGPDCFLFVFPQDDVLGKLYAYGTGNIVVDKPHNLYLQIFINEGGVALLAFLGICAVYLWDCVRLYGKNPRTAGAFRGIGVALGVIGYLFAGLFNDSTVMTSAVFWILLGIGVGMNRQYRAESVGQ